MDKEIEELARDLDCGENCPAPITPEISCNVCQAERLVKLGYRKPLPTKKQVEEIARRVYRFIHPNINLELMNWVALKSTSLSAEKCEVFARQLLSLLNSNKRQEGRIKEKMERING